MIFGGKKTKLSHLCYELITQAEDGVIVIDSAHRIVLFNAAAEQMFGYTEKEMEGERLDALMPERFQLQHDILIDEFGAGIAETRTTHRRGRQIFGRRKDGVEFMAEAQILRLGTKNNRYFAAFFRDVSESRQTEEELLRLASKDPLTGAYNRREFTVMAEREALRSHRYHHSLSLMMLDIDHFKRLNDTFGHSAGDKILQRFTAICTNTLRNADIFGRWGGEEFVALLPETDIDGAAVIAERLRKLIGENVLSFNDQKITFTVSVGVVQYKDGETGIEGPITRVDGAVYDAKKAGRNCISVFRN